MKRSELKLGTLVKFVKNSCEFHTYYLSDIYDKLSSQSLPYGQSKPTPHKNDNVVYECIHVGSMDNYDSDCYPRFVRLDEQGQRTNFVYEIHNCACIEPVEDSYVTEISGLTPRQIQAVKLRKEAKGLEKKVKELQEQINQLQERIRQAENTATAYENYNSDEEALAAMLAEAISSGGDVAKITEILKKTGVTMRL